MKQEQNEFVTMLRYITVRCTMMVFAFGVYLSLASCDEEDEDPGEDTGYVDGGNQDGADTSGGNQGEMQITASDLVGRTFYCYTSRPDGQGNVDVTEYTVEFTTTTECHLTQSGYEWEWYGGWQQEFFNDEATRSYTVSGNVIKIARYPFGGGGTRELIYLGAYLSDGGSEVWNEI